MEPHLAEAWRFIFSRGLELRGTWHMQCKHDPPGLIFAQMSYLSVAEDRGDRSLSDS